MNFDNLIGTLLSLFEKKMDFMKAMSEREMSLKEKTESNKTDLEYRKLEAQITTDKDKQAWEKEKLTTTIKGNYDLNAAQQAGLVARDVTKFASEKDLQDAKIVAEKDMAGDKNKTAIYEANTKTMTELMKIGTGTKIKTTDPVTGAITESVTEGNQQAKGMGNIMAQRLDLVPTAETTQPNARFDDKLNGVVQTIQTLKAAGDPQRLETYLSQLDPAVKVAAGAKLGTTPMTPAAPVQPAATAPPARPELQAVDRHLRPDPWEGRPVPGAPIVGAQFAERGPLTTDLTLPGAAGGRAFGIFNTPAQVAQANDPARAAAIQKQADADEEARKRRVAIRQARGLTSIGF